MPDRRSIWETRIVVFGVVLAAIVGVGATAGLLWSWLAPTTAPERDAGTGAGAQVHPEWTGGGAREVALTIDPVRGPQWAVSGADAIPLTPVPNEASLSWSTARIDGALLVRARGTWREADVRARWRFEPGNPQASFEIRVHDVPLEHLRERDWSATLELPPGTIRTSDGRVGLIEGEELDPSHPISAWDPFWVQWSGDTHALALLDWTGDGATIRPAGDGAEIELHLWRADAHSTVSSCEAADGDSGPTIDLAASSVVHVGDAPAVFAGRIPAGREAAIAPIFDVANAHPDSTLHRGDAESPGDWAARARTLAFGHSKADDPRYGNGGLLGHGLGGTIAVPSEWRETDAVGDFVDEVDGSPLGTAARGEAPGPDSASATAIGAKFDCGSVLGDGAGGLEVAVDDFVPFRERLVSAVEASRGDAAPRLAPPRPGLATAARPLRLDGTRPELTEGALADTSLDHLLRTRGIATFATPLVGSRNPLIPAAHEALLDPERHGEWTLAAPFTEALAHLEIATDTKPLAIRDLSSLVTYWRRARRAIRRWNGDGELLVRTAEPIAGYTLVVDGIPIGADQIAIAGAEEIRVRQTTHETGPGAPTPQTWISWNLDADTTYRVAFGEATSAITDPTPVRWTVRE